MLGLDSYNQYKKYYSEQLYIKIVKNRKKMCKL